MNTFHTETKLDSSNHRKGFGQTVKIEKNKKVVTGNCTDGDYTVAISNLYSNIKNK
jgi:hypothetical protein